MKSCLLAFTAFALILLFWALVLVLVATDQLAPASEIASRNSHGDFVSYFPSGLVSSALGALAGSLSAFYLGIHQQRIDRKEKQHAALLRTYFALLSQWNILEGIRKGLLEPNRAHPERFTRMPEYRISARCARVPFDEIAFITVVDDANVLQEVQIAEQGFDTAIGALDIWNARVHGLHSSPEVDVREFDFATGAGKIAVPLPMMYFIKKAADVLYEVVDEALAKTVTEIRSVENLTKRLFPGMKALTMVPKENNDVTTKQSGENPSTPKA